MISEMKYVVVQSEEQGAQMFIFPKNVNHADFAEVLSMIRVHKGRNWERVYREPISAGFTDGKACYGRSESLGLNSEVTDDALLSSGGSQFQSSSGSEFQ